MRRAATMLLAGASWLLVAVSASGHPLAPALLEVREEASGRAAVLWRTPLLKPTGGAVEPSLPPECKSLAPPRVDEEGAGLTYRWSVSCGPGGWVGRRIEVSGLDETRSATLVRVVLADGHVVQALLDGDSPALTVSERATRTVLAARYVWLGVSHLLGGIDHLLFVLALFLLVAAPHPLLISLTAFTAGHSVTLAAAVLGVVRVPQAPIEVGIAASILLPAAMLAAGRETGRRDRRPWVMAFAFGLLHGLGFAGALAEIGLPAGEIPLALASFNAGIEAGQVAVVSGFAILVLLARRLGPVSRPQLLRAPAYAIGSAAAFLALDRAASLLAVLF